MIPVCHRLPDQERAACHLRSGSAWNADGEIREVSKPFPPLPPTHPPPAAISSSWPGGAILLAAGPTQFPMYLRCHAWSVSPNGSYLFIPAATRAYGMFSSQLTCFFSQPRQSVRLIWGALNPGESRPNTSAESRGNFQTFTRCPPPSARLLASSQVYLVLYLQKEKKKKKNCAAALH